MNNQDSLRTQIIEAMNNHSKTGLADNADMFDLAIMPVLDAAMKAGELLLHRATTPQKPVNESIVAWLDGCCTVIATVHHQESTASKRELLSILYQLEEAAIIALADSKKLMTETANEEMGRLLAGKSILPAKG